MKLPTAAPISGLVWFPEWAMGYYPVVDGSNGDSIYNDAYYENYCRMRETDIGKRITWARLALVDRWMPRDPMIDVGIGSGAFLDARSKAAPTFGWDINPAAVALLQKQELLLDPTLIWSATEGQRMGMSFWDSLEHIKEPDEMLRNAQWVFCSLPIFDGPEHVLRSKHFKPQEHCWYFTRGGLIQWMGQRGFTCREHNTAETLLGREDIHSFAFERV
jgi:hypothetical protein